jgi:capsular polysaccharide biosynthesis protein
MTRNLMEAKLQLEDPPVEIVIVETAVPATKPVFPLPVLNAAVAGLTGIAAGSYYALLMGYLARLKKVRIRREMDWSPLVDGRFIDFIRGKSTAETGR